MNAYRTWLLFCRWFCELRSRQCYAASARWMRRRAGVIAELATADEEELQIWDRQ